MSYPIIIFGAGATADYAAVKKIQPPLGQDIFNFKKMRYLKIQDNQLLYGNVKKFLKEIEKEDGTLEEKLERAKNEAKGNLKSWKRAPLIFLEFRLKDIFQKISEECRTDSKINNYKILINCIKRHINDSEILYLTLNYDTLIDEALGITPVTDINYTESLLDKYYLDKQLVKAHGSCDWGYYLRESDKSFTQSGREFRVLNMSELSTIFSDICDLPEEKEITRTINHETKKEGGKYTQFEPAMIMPTKNKRLICPGAHREKLIKALNLTDRILIIGWAGADDDIVDLMKKEIKKPVKILIVSGGENEAKDVKSNLEKANIKDLSFETTAYKFSDFVKNEKNIEQFLKG